RGPMTVVFHEARDRWIRGLLARNPCAIGIQPVHTRVDSRGLLWTPAKGDSMKNNFAVGVPRKWNVSDLDTAAELDYAVGGQLEEVAGVGREARQDQEQLLLPARQQRPLGGDEAVAADEVGGAHRLDRHAAIGERQQVAR